MGLLGKLEDMKEKSNCSKEKDSFTSISLKSPTRKKLKMKKIEEEYASYDQLLNRELFNNNGD